MDSNQHFILDILEDQKRRKKRRIELIREEFQENLNEQAIIDELINMPGFERFKQNQETQQQQQQQTTTTTTTTTQHRHPTNHKRRPSKPNSNNKKEPDATTNNTIGISKRKGKKPNVKRDHLGAHQKLMEDFFRFDPLEEEPSNDNQQQKNEGEPQLEEVERQKEEENARFYDQFKLSKNLFRQIHADLIKNDLHFTQRKDALGNLGHSSYQKVLVAIRQLSHGIGKPAAILDEYIRMAESTALESLIRFCYNLEELYGPRYLRQPTTDELGRISQHNQARGFPEGLHGYLGTRSWEWESCPTGWSGRFKTHSTTTPASTLGGSADANGTIGFKKNKLPPTIVLEALVDHRGWLWAGFVSTPGTCKDLDLFHPLPPIYAPSFFDPPLLPSSTLPSAYYCLAEPLYPPSPPLKSLDNLLPHRPHHQETLNHLKRTLQDDFQRAIDALQTRFKIIYLPCRLWSSNSMNILIKTAFILHNMIIDDHPPPASTPPPPPPSAPPSDNPPSKTIGVTDIQVYPSSSSSNTVNNVSSNPMDHQNKIPPHAFAKLNHRYQFFNPSSSLIPQD